MSAVPWYQRPVPRLLLWAGTLALLFCLAHVLGWRQYTALLSGTVPLNLACRLRGAAYIALYAGVVFIAPIYVIAAALLAIATAVRNRCLRQT